MKSILMVIFLLQPLTVWCHSKLLATEPANQAVLNRFPGQVKLTFNKTIEPHFNQAELLVNERWISLNSFVDNKVLTISLENITLKHYQIRWSVISQDGHRERGLLQFSKK